MVTLASYPKCFLTYFYPGPSLNIDKYVMYVHNEYYVHTFMAWHVCVFWSPITSPLSMRGIFLNVLPAFNLQTCQGFNKIIFQNICNAACAYLNGSFLYPFGFVDYFCQNIHKLIDFRIILWCTYPLILTLFTLT